VMVRAHALGLKAVAIYRDGCKKVQPLSGPQGRSAAAPAAALSAALATAAADTPPCSLCGAPLVRLGPCYRCENCGSTTACG
jgi:ribonucleotide reductase alpha subunit